MAPGYNYPDAGRDKISDLLAPAYLLLALGLDYKPNRPFQCIYCTGDWKNDLLLIDKILSDAGAFGVKPGQKSLSEFGGYLRAIYTKNDFKSEFLKNVTFTTKIDLFSNYTQKSPKYCSELGNIISV